MHNGSIVRCQHNWVLATHAKLKDLFGMKEERDPYYPACVFFSMKLNWVSFSWKSCVPKYAPSSIILEHSVRLVRWRVDLYKSRSFNSDRFKSNYSRLYHDRDLALFPHRNLMKGTTTERNGELWLPKLTKWTAQLNTIGCLAHTRDIACVMILWWALTVSLHAC